MDASFEHYPVTAYTGELPGDSTERETVQGKTVTAGPHGDPHGVLFRDAAADATCAAASSAAASAGSAKKVCDVGIPCRSLGKWMTYLMGFNELSWDSVGV